MDIPLGLCQCGCGETTRPIASSHAARGYVGGQPHLYARGHHPWRSAEERFWEKVDKNGPTVRPELGPCWDWTGAIVATTGYGMFHPKKSGLARSMSAHKYAYIVNVGAIPLGIQIRHVCDRRRCIRPSHMLIGTALDNAQDKVARNRQQKGEAVNTAKLTAEQATEIRRRYAAGEPSRALGREYGISKTAVLYIVRRRNWKHVA